MSRGLADRIHIYEDVWFEADGYSGVERLCVDSPGTLIGFFSERAAEDLRVLVRESDKETAILELEMVAITLAIHLWQRLLLTRRAVVFFRQRVSQMQHHQGLLQESFCGLLHE